MSTKKDLPDKQHFAARVRVETVQRVRWLAFKDVSKPGKLGETVDYLLTRALDDMGVPPAGEL